MISSVLSFGIPSIALIAHSVVCFKHRKKYNIIVYLFFASLPLLTENRYIPYANEINKALFICSIINIIYLVLIKRSKLYLDKNITVFLIVTIFVGIFAAKFTNTFFQGILNLTYQVLIAQVLYFFVIKLKSIDWILMIFQVNAILLSMGAILEFFVEGSRASVTFFNPNFLAIYLVIGVYSLICTKNHILLIGLVLIGIYATNSITSLSCLLFFYFVNFYDKKSFSRKNKYRLILIFMLVIFLLITFYSAIQGGSYSNVIKSSIVLFPQRDTLRNYIWLSAFLVFFDNWVFGVGHHNFRVIMEKYYFQTETYYSLHPGGWSSHNDYLRILAEGGIVLFVVFLKIIFNSFHFISKVDDDRYRRYLLCSLLSILLFILTHNLMSTYIFWILIVLPKATFIALMNNN